LDRLVLLSLRKDSVDCCERGDGRHNPLLLYCSNAIERDPSDEEYVLGAARLREESVATMTEDPVLYLHAIETPRQAMAADLMLPDVNETFFDAIQPVAATVVTSRREGVVPPSVPGCKMPTVR
jgi:hypothetical protein